MSKSCLFLLGLFLFCARCSDLERSNPYDPASRGAPLAQAALSLYVPLSKPLLSVVHRLEATLEGPDLPPLVKELSISPLGPATGTIGTLPAGSGFVLTLRGYDLEDQLIFEGRQENIAIRAGDTTRVELVLTLTRPLPDTGEDAQDQTPPPGEETDEAGEGEATGEESPPPEQGGTEPEASSAGEGEATGEEGAGSETSEETSTQSGAG